MSSLSLKYKSSQFRQSSFCMMFQIAIDINELLYDDLPIQTFADRLKKAKAIKGISQKELADLTGISRSCINELEAGYRDNISICTLNKLISVLDKNILCDDYLNFVLNQQQYINEAIDKKGITNLCKYIKSHHSTVYRWRDNKNKIPYNKYILLKEMDQD